MSFKKFLKYSFYFMIPCTWYHIGTYEKNVIRESMYGRGYNLSQKFKKYTFWDNYVEPFMIRQFSILFTGGNAFIKGMLSDNVNKKIVSDTIKEFKDDVKKELDELDKK